MTAPKSEAKRLKSIQKTFSCGQIHVIGNQARFSIQKISDISTAVIPFLKSNTLAGKKKKDFDMWQRAVTILEKNKGVHMQKWKKNDLHSLIEIHKSIARYKSNPKQAKWIDMARTIVKTA